MCEIKLNKVGRIIRGKSLDWYIKIISGNEDNDENYGEEDFFILYSEKAEFVCEYDGWVEDYEVLLTHFRDYNWVIEWLDEDNNES